MSNKDPGGLKLYNVESFVTRANRSLFFTERIIRNKRNPSIQRILPFMVNIEQNVDTKIIDRLVLN